MDTCYVSLKQYVMKIGQLAQNVLTGDQQLDITR